MGLLSMRNVYVRGKTSSSRIYTDPVADFTTDIISGPAPLTVNFTDTTTNTPTSWAWDFTNDGTVDSTSQNPSHTYTTPGVYAVKLIATNQGGSGEIVKTGFITVLIPAPVANFTVSPSSGVLPLTVSFTDTSTNSPTGWEWDFTNDGITDSTDQNPSFVYSSAGTYQVKLRATNSTGTGEVVKSNVVTVVAPVYSLSKSAASVNEGSNVTVTLSTQYVAPGAIIPYTISGTGITSSDINGASLTGTFVISGTLESGTASLVLSVSADVLTEGAETLTLTLDTRPTTVSIVLNDTSKTPVYSLSSSPTSVNEPGTFTVTLSTENVSPGTVIPYTISGTGITSGDINNSSLTGSFTVSGTYASGTATLTLNTTADQSTEGAETLAVALNNGQASTTVTINDTSSGPTYALSTSSATINEGETVTYTLTTTNVANGTNIPYTITGAVYGELDGYRALTGNFTVSNGTASTTLTPLIDQMGYGNKNMTISLNNVPGVSATVQVLQVASTPAYRFTQKYSTAASGTGGVPTGVAADGANIWTSGSTYSSGWVGTTFTATGPNTFIKYAVDDYATVYVNGLKFYGQYGGTWYTATFPTTAGQTYYVSVSLSDTGGSRGFKMSIRNGTTEAGALIKNTSTSGWVRT